MNIDWDPNPQELDTVLTNLEIGKVIKRGKRSYIYEVWYEQSGEKTHTALKLNNPERIDWSELKYGLEEWETIKSTSKHIVDLYQYGNDPVYWYTMELMDENLRSRMKSGKDKTGPLAVNEAIKYTEQILKALSAVHGRWIHYDLKPENILLSQNSNQDYANAKISDWERVYKHGTKDRMLRVSTGYMPPEDGFGEGFDLQAERDLYQVGLILYEMLTGSIPFEDVEWRLKMAKEDPEQIRIDGSRLPSEVNNSVPSEVDEVVATLLEPDPEKRWASAEKARQALLSSV